MTFRSFVAGVLVGLVLASGSSLALQEKPDFAQLQKTYEERAKGMLNAEAFIERQNDGSGQGVALGYVMGVLDTLSFVVNRYTGREDGKPKLITDETFDRAVVLQLKVFDACLLSQFDGVRLGTFTQALADRLDSLSGRSLTGQSAVIGFWTTTCERGRPQK